MADRDPHKLKTFAIIIYALYLIPGGVLSLIGLVLAYLRVGRGGPGPDSHFIFQIRSFWIGLIYTVFFGVLSWPFGLQKTVLFLIAIWFFARALIGLIRALNSQSIPKPRSWFLGL